MTTLICIVVFSSIGFVAGVFSERKNGLVARAEKGQQDAIAALKDKVGKL